jgi:hypothetical protein
VELLYSTRGCHIESQLLVVPHKILNVQQSEWFSCLVCGAGCLISSYRCTKFFCGCPCSCEVVLLGIDNMGCGRYIRNGVLTVSTPGCVLSPCNFHVSMKEVEITPTSFLFPFHSFSCLAVHYLCTY